MTRTRLAFLALALSSAVLVAQAQDADDDLFAGLDWQKPECVRALPGGGHVVSNVNGDFTARDNNGFLSRVAADGAADLRWIAGGEGEVTLNAPKGMLLQDGELVVADIDHLRVFDAETGDPVRAVQIEGARFLNDIAAGEDGTLYVTDTGTEDSAGGLYRVTTDGSVETLLDGTDKDLQRPNGLAMAPDGTLRMVTFGGNTVFTVSPDGEILDRREIDHGQLDGLFITGDGEVMVSSWEAGSILRLTDDGTETVMDGLTDPACFLVEAGRLIVPQPTVDAVAVGAVSG